MNIFLVFVFLTLIVLVLYDFKYKAVPDYLLILLVLFASFTHNFDFAIAFQFAGAIVILELFITFYIQNIKIKITKDERLRTQKALGEGDIPIFAVIGGILGIKLGVGAIFISAICAIIGALFYIFIKKENETPFIPFLTMGLSIVYFNQTYFIQQIMEIVK